MGVAIEGLKLFVDMGMLVMLVVIWREMRRQGSAVQLLLDSLIEVCLSEEGAMRVRQARLAYKAPEHVDEDERPTMLPPTESGGSR